MLEVTKLFETCVPITNLSPSHFSYSVGYTSGCGMLIGGDNDVVCTSFFGLPDVSWCASTALVLQYISTVSIITACWFLVLRTKVPVRTIAEKCSTWGWNSQSLFSKAHTSSASGTYWRCARSLEKGEATIRFSVAGTTSGVHLTHKPLSSIMEIERRSK